MNYQKLHDAIISKALDRGWTRETATCYVEKHHIVPRSMGGNEDKDNLVILTGREHFIIHWLLYKIYKTSPMAFAFHAMTLKGKNRDRYTSHSFAYAREASAKACRGRVASEETRRKISEAHTGKIVSKETRERMSKAFSGRVYTEKTRANMAKGQLKYLETHVSPRLGKTHSDESKAKISVAAMGNTRWLGKVHSSEAKDKIREFRRKWTYFVNGIPFDSPEVAGTHIGKSSSYIKVHSQKCSTPEITRKLYK